MDKQAQFSTYIEVEEFQDTFVGDQKEEIMSHWIDHWYTMNFMPNQGNNGGVQTKFNVVISSQWNVSLTYPLASVF